MDGNIQANIQQIRDCLQKYSTWGENHIINICSGQTHVIPWGIEDYLLIMILIFILIMVSFFIFLTWRNF
mgnify:CR=1 FL=1